MKGFLFVLMIAVFFLAACSENTGEIGTDIDSMDDSDISDLSDNQSDVSDMSDMSEVSDIDTETNDSGHGDNTPDPETETVKLVAAGSAHVCAVKDSGHLYCWGQGNQGQLGNNQTPGGDDPNTNPLMVGDEAWQTVCGMIDSTCGIKKNGEAFCWGDNSDGQLANSLDGFTMPASGQISPIFLGADDNQYGPLFCGGTTILAYQNNDLWGWGSNRMGQLANGMVGYDASYPGGSATAYVPRLLNENANDWPKFEKVSISLVHACGITVEGDLYCWGSYDMGNFGDGKRGDGFDLYSFRTQAVYSVFDKPLKIGDSKWIDVTAMSNNGCGIKEDGTLWCWGVADWGVLGIGDVFESYEPGTPQDKVTYTEKFQALVDDGKCEVQFISKDEVASKERRYPPICTQPVQVGSNNKWVSVEGMTNHVCAINSDDELFCWGDNEYGQIGNGEHGDTYFDLPSDYDIVSTPTKIDGEYLLVSPGYNFTCAISKDKKVYCWGYSELGIPGFIGNKNNPQATPVKIGF